MPDMRAIVDRIHYENRRDYTNKQGNVSYLDGAPLKRPFDMPKAQRIIALIIVAIGVVIGAYLINDLVVSKWRAVADAEQAVVENLDREASIVTVPQVASFINQDNEAIKAAFESSGYTIYDASSADEPNEMMLYKLPSDVSVPEAALAYSKGVSSLSAQEASLLLNGSWSFSADRSSGVSMVVRYADFSTSDPQIAVQDAIAKEGFDSSSVTESGVDDSGNTYSTGTLEAEGTSCTWKVSALPLDEMYSVAGLPEDACYVGIRVTAV